MCKEWQITPMEFDRRVAADEILLVDVQDYIKMVIRTEPFRSELILNALYGDKVKRYKERIAKLKEEIESAKNYYKMLHPATTDNEEAKQKELESVSERIKELQGRLASG